MTMTPSSPADPIPPTELVDQGRAIRVHAREADDLCELLTLLGVRCGPPRLPLPVAQDERATTSPVPTGIKRLNLSRTLAVDHDAGDAQPTVGAESSPGNSSELVTPADASTPWREIPLEPAAPEELRRVTELVAEFNRQRGSRAAFERQRQLAEGAIHPTSRSFTPSRRRSRP